jgi:hypothetical protein
MKKRITRKKVNSKTRRFIRLGKHMSRDAGAAQRDDRD